MNLTVIDQDTPQTWPADVLEFLDEHYQLFLDWETNHKNVSAAKYDEAICGLQDALRPYAIKGWHCTRLTEAEVASIVANGMQLPNLAMLSRRIIALESEKLVTPAVANVLKSKNQADEENRAGRVWFCFFPPRNAGEGGIGDLLRHWGGEALYNSHDRDPKIGPILRSIGMPCLIEANVPIACLGRHGGLSFKIVRRYLTSLGHYINEPVEHEDRVVCPLAPEFICRVIKFPEPDFLALTGCEGWGDPLS